MSGDPDISETEKEHIDKLVKAKLETNSPIVREFSSILQAESEDGKEGYTSFINQYFGVLVGCSLSGRVSVSRNVNFARKLVTYNKKEKI